MFRLESVISSAQYPLIPYEVHGDIITFYATSDGTAVMAHTVCQQVEQFFRVFRKKQKELMEVYGEVAGVSIKKLKLKAVLHHGEVVITQVETFKKIAGEDMILAHRLLKNSVRMDEYVLLTEKFRRQAAYNASQTPETIHEYYPYLGKVKAWVYYPTALTIKEKTSSDAPQPYVENNRQASSPALACA